MMYTHTKEKFLTQLELLSSFFEYNACYLDGVKYSGPEVQVILQEELKALPRDSLEESRTQAENFRSIFDHLGDYRFEGMLPPSPGAVSWCARVNGVRRADPLSEVFIDQTRPYVIRQWFDTNGEAWEVIAFTESSWVLFIGQSIAPKFVNSPVVRVQNRHGLGKYWDVIR